MSKRQSTWTRVYMTCENPEMSYYVRFTPNFVELERAGFSHGLSLGTATFATKVEAEAWADRLDEYFEVVKGNIIEDAKASGVLS